MKFSKVFFHISFFFFLFTHLQSNASWLSTDLAQFKAMDKITARTSSINIYLDDEVELGTLIIFPSIGAHGHQLVVSGGFRRVQLDFKGPSYK